MLSLLPQMQALRQQQQQLQQQRLAAVTPSLLPLLLPQRRVSALKQQQLSWQNLRCTFALSLLDLRSFWPVQV
jgi:hypothetical protein